MNPKAFSPSEAARISGVGRTTIFAEIKQHRLTARKCGRRTLILEDDLLQWLRTLPASKANPSLNLSTEGAGQ